MIKTIKVKKADGKKILIVQERRGEKTFLVLSSH